jgi:DNA-binding LacI/PurR family transcriptional regulator
MTMQLDRNNAIPMYLQLLNQIREQIVSGKWEPGRQLPTEAELASELNISRVTVRQALQAAVDEGLVTRTAGKGTFVGSNHDKPRIDGFVGYVVPHLSSSFNVQIMLGAESVLRCEGYQMIFCNSEAKIEEENQLLNRLATEGMAGCIIQPVQGSNEGRALRKIVAKRFPVVMIDRLVSGIDADVVMSDHFGGGYAVVQHLLEQGYTDILYAANPMIQLYSVAERARGYKTAMLDARLEPRAPFVAGSSAELGFIQSPIAFAQREAATITAIAEYLQTSSRPQVIIAMNDLYALLVYEAIRRIGLRVPDDIALVGYDDLDFAATLTPALTTVSQDPFELGAEAARLLIERIRGDTRSSRQVRLKSHLIVRQSSLNLTLNSNKSTVATTS